MIDLTPVARFGLLLVRPGLVVMAAPGLGGLHAPAQVRIGLTVLLAIAMLPVVRIPASASDLDLTITIAREAAIGLALALATRALIAAAEFGGYLSGFQLGLSYGATVDPATGVRNPVLATLYGMLALLAFLGADGHHALIRALALSYAALPIGAGHVDASLAGAVRQMLALVFVVGVRLAAPVVAVLFVVELAIGLISRSAPAVSAMVVGAPLRLIAGLAALAFAVASVPGVIVSLIDQAIELALRGAAAFR